MNKKAQELTLTKALAIAIGIVVLIILIYGFATKSGIFKEQAFGCESKHRENAHKGLFVVWI